MTVMQLNPFVIGKYVSDEYFCDRSEETLFLIKQIVNGRNTVLISPRRMGKTGLIHHCFNQDEIAKDYYTFFVDIYATESLQEFVYLLGKAIYEGLKPQKTLWAERFLQIVKSLRLGFKIDAISGEPGFDIGLGDIEVPETTLDEIFQYLESADKPCVIAIDEFQQIGSYKEKNVEAILRTKIQQCRQSVFIFAGSRQHVLNNMFSSASKPFYQSAVNMGLNPIPIDVYCNFAERMFAENGKTVERQVVEKSYLAFSGCTWFVQMMLNELFAITPKGKKCTADYYDIAWQNVVQSQYLSFSDTFSRISPRQRLLLLSIAKEGKVSGITSAEFIKKYKLVSSSSVQSSLKALIANDIVVKDGDGYRIYDYFFADWLRHNY